MLAAVFEGNGKLTLLDRPKPTIKKDTDVLLKVTGVGICGTDLHILQVPPAHPATVGAILGHEFTGTVVETGSAVTEFKSGDNVLVDPHPGCGQCPQCQQGRPDQCIPLYINGKQQTIGIFSDGAMASYVVVPNYSLYKLKNNVPAQFAALAEPLSCIYAATQKLKVQPGDTVVILGAGPIGLLFTCILKACGAAKVIVSEPAEYRRNLAVKCGATRVCNPKEENLKKIVIGETGEGCDFAVEAVGPLINETLYLVKQGGKVIQFGHDELVKPPIHVAELVRKEITIHGAYTGKFAFEKVARIIESGVLPLENIVSHQLPLLKIHEGLELLRQGKAIKIILHPEEY